MQIVHGGIDLLADRQSLAMRESNNIITASSFQKRKAACPLLGDAVRPLVPFCAIDCARGVAGI
jgi:hypothetical protein